VGQRGKLGQFGRIDIACGMARLSHATDRASPGPAQRHRAIQPNKSLGGLHPKAFADDSEQTGISD
jgi:hypothetical protein